MYFRPGIPHHEPSDRANYFGMLLMRMRLLNPFFDILGAATHPQLARMVEYLKAENRILRDKLPGG